MEATDEMEMGERGAEREAEREANEEAETSFTEDRADRERDESVLIIDGSNPVFERVDTDDKDLDIDSRLKRMGKSDGKVKRVMIHNKKQFLKDGLGITVNKRDGPNSTILFDNLRTTTSEKTNKINGATYKGKKILILKDGKMQYSTARDKLSYVNEFKELLKKADKEHQKRPVSMAEKAAGVDITRETMDSITRSVSDKIESRIESNIDDMNANAGITIQELREIRGPLDINIDGMTPEFAEMKVKSLGEHANEFRKLAKTNKNDVLKSKTYETAAQTAELKADQIRLTVLNEKPETDEVISMLEEESVTNDMTRFEKFKKWVRSNFTTLSLTLITVGGTISSIVTAARQALNRGKQGLSNFGKALVNLAKKVGPALATILKVVAQLLTLGAKGLSFIAENLWLVVLFVVYLVYSEFASWRNRRSRMETN